MDNDAGRRFYPNQAYLNAIFENYDISFRDPDHIVRILEHIITNELPDLEYTDADDYYDAMQGTNAKELHDLIEEISRLPLHRHRTDAQNIIREVASRIYRKEPATVLVPAPEEARYQGPDAQTPDFTFQEIPDHYRRELLDNAGKLLWRPGDSFPRAWRNPQTQVRTTYALPENEDLSELIVQDLATTQSIRTVMLNLLSFGEHPQLYKPPVYLDDPAEICLAMPEDCPFLTAPTPRSDLMNELLAESLPELQIWDLRLGDRETIGRLGVKHYIYKLVSLARRTVSNPDIARAYAFIFRAHPARYAAFSDDEIVDEEPPTVEEVECVISFMRQTFPDIEVKELEDGAPAFHDRHFLNVINLNSSLFDDVEDAHRRGEGVGHLLYYVFVTLIHELGHWFYSCIYLQRQVMPGVLHTPRKLRLLIRPGRAAEDPWDPASDMTDVLYGELGQLIEWLVFGFVVDLNVNRPGALVVKCWGSYAGQGWNQITINNFAALRLLAARPPVRMDASALRNFLATMAEAEAAQSSPEPESISGEPLNDMEMPDVDEQYTGYNIDNENSVYRRAVQRVRNESRRPRKDPRPVIPRVRVRGHRPVEPLRPPGVARRFLVVSHMALAVVSCFALYFAFDYDPMRFERYESLWINRPTGSFDRMIVSVLVLLLVALWFGVPAGRVFYSVYN